MEQKQHITQNNTNEQNHTSAARSLHVTQEQSGQTAAILAAADLGEYDVDRSLDELEELARTAGAVVLARVVQKRPAYDPASCIGTGKLEELCGLCQALEPDLLVFDCELTATQIRNIEKLTNVRTIDRTMLILDIFAGRAHTAEGKLQVELAQQKYRLPRLAGMGLEMSRLGAGIGTRGPGESQLETDRRHIRRRISSLERQLKELSARREHSRARRKKDGELIAAVVGYTNAGKSTLLNALTGASVLAENKLFATLDLTARALPLPDGRTVLLTDTVGFIQRLPHHLVEAFQSTLEEAASADLLLHVLDASSPDVREQAEVTERLLNELGCRDIPRITVLNKCDLLEHPLLSDEKSVMISAKTGDGLEELKSRLAAALPETTVSMWLRIPYDQSGLLDRIRQEGKVLQEQYISEGTVIFAAVDRKITARVEPYRIDAEQAVQLLKQENAVNSL